MTTSVQSPVVCRHSRGVGRTMAYALAAEIGRDPLVRILILDDHAVVRRGLRTVLEAQSGWTVVGEAADGRSGVEMARQLQPDVVVADIAMPVMNGLDATRRIREISPRSAILVFTMIDSEELVRDVLSAGARGYLLKSDIDRLVVTAVEALSAGLPFLNTAASERVLEGYLRNPNATRAGHEPLTLREREVCQAVAEGLTNKEAARRLGISLKTIETHRSSLMRKIGAHNTLEIARYAARNKITFD